ncbi:GW dipeptide domain-containing protein [Lentilactobacillus raoultii]|uniref:GW dipeptide domain-containing protein n=1 Tax=Lentilactobacillus raoultii TaxID=1987503 RepID=A0ABW3PMS9_9LACO|nr:GW dipeptide domain-containing protein [Lentilactobacillus raoultii]
MKQSIKRGLLLASAWTTIVGGALILSDRSVEAAKTKITHHKALKTKVNRRNVEPTGKAGLYTKPSALTGEKQVLSKKTMKKMDRSENPDHYFRAYRVAKTNRQQVYYKVVSFDGKYRGWVYGGKKINQFSGGVSRAETYHEVGLTAEQRQKTYRFANPGTHHVTWRVPETTTYKPTKVINSTTPYAGDSLSIKSAVEQEKGDLVYYYVASKQHPQINGWINSKALTLKTAGQSTVPDNAGSSTPAPVPTPSEQPPTTNPGSSNGGSLNYSGSFKYTDAKVMKNAFSQETDQAMIDKVQKSYKEAIIKNLPEPFKYDQSMSLVEVANKLGHGKRFTAEGGRNYMVVVNPTVQSLVTLVPYSQIKWINPKAEVSGLNTGFIGMFLNDELKSQIQTAVNLLYKVNYLGSLVIMSPMSDNTVKNLLGDGKQLTINVETFFEELPIKLKFDISVKIDRDDNGISGVNVDLKLDPASLIVPDPANPANCQMDVDSKALGLSGFKDTLFKAAVKVFYSIRYPYYNKIDQSMNPEKVKRVLGHGKTIAIDQAGVKANLTMQVDVEQAGGSVKNVSVKTIATKPTE